MVRLGGLRLYRGLSKKFNPDEVGERQRGGMTGINFTDCPGCSQERTEFAEELPKFVAEIKKIFAPHEIAEFFEDLHAGRVPDTVEGLPT